MGSSIHSEESTVGIQQKGFSLQKKRALVSILEEIHENPDTTLCVAVELNSDVYTEKIEDGKVDIQEEEDKNLDTEKGLTLNSKEVLNTLFNFYVNWLVKNQSKNLKFRFYSTTKISIERETVLSEELDYSFPEDGLLKAIINKEELSEESLEYIKKSIDKLIIDRSKENSFNLTFETIPNEKFKLFLEQIEWLFNQEDQDKVDESLIKLIMKCRYFESALRGKEELIRDHLLVKLEKKQPKTDILERTLNKTDVENAFLKAKTNSIPKIDDTAHQLWGEILNDEDSSPIEDKIDTICTDFDYKLLKHYKRIITRAIGEERDFKHLEDFKSILVRTYELSFEKLDELQIKANKNLTTEEVKEIHKELLEYCFSDLDELAKSRNYRFADKSTIKGIILHLFDRCILNYSWKNE